MYGLNIHLHSIYLNNDIINQNDKVRVSITTIPEENKDAFVIDAKNMNSVHHFFTININSYTEKIIFVFRKKSFIQNDPIIASTIIHANEFPKSKDDPSNSQIRQIYIYEPLSKIHCEKDHSKGSNRKIVGEMEIQLSAEDLYPTLSYNNKVQTGKRQNSKSYGKMSSNDNDENKLHNDNGILFIDNGL